MKTPSVVVVNKDPDESWETRIAGSLFNAQNIANLNQDINNNPDIDFIWKKKRPLKRKIRSGIPLSFIV